MAAVSVLATPKKDALQLDEVEFTSAHPAWETNPRELVLNDMERGSVGELRR